MLLLSLLIACTPGLNQDTVIDELRVVAAVAEPPEIGLGETATVEIHIADPRGEEPLVWVWLDDHIETPELVDGVVRFEVPAQTVAAPLAIWTLACLPELCPPIDAASVQDPAALVADLPFDGVSLALKRVVVSMRSDEQRARNPILTPLDPMPGADGEPLRLRFGIESEAAVELWAYSTAGGFGMPSLVTQPGVAELDFYPTTSDGDVYVVAVDEGGGTAVWRGPAPVD